MNNELSIYEAIPAIMGEVGPIAKNQRVKDGPVKYNFRGIDDAYNALNSLMAKYKICNSCKILSSESKDIVSKSGTKGVYKAIHYEFTFYSVDGSHIKYEAIGEAIDYGDKAANKCAAIAHKYALTQIFIIPYADMDDPDKTTHEIVENLSIENIMKTRKWIIPFGKKYNGVNIFSLDLNEVFSYSDYLEDAARKNSKPLNGEGKRFVEIAEALHKENGGR